MKPPLRSRDSKTMFTGIVEEVGRIRTAEPFESGLRIRIAASRVLDGLREGDSIAVDGVCQTVVELHGNEFAFESMRPTLDRTTLGDARPDRPVNLERALALGDRLGGHMVQGHVDGTGEVRSVERRAEHVRMEIALPDDVAAVTVPRGSIAVNGVSLTVAAKPEPGVACVALIPYTWENTNLSTLDESDRVNVEGDMLGRFVIDYLARTGWTEPGKQASTERSGGRDAV